MMWVARQILHLSLLWWMARAQVGVINRAPQFLANNDMSRFAIPEDTPPGTAVYKLTGLDPEGTKVFYSISGDHFTVDKNTGVVSTVKNFDREKEDIVTVVISITDESLDGSEPNTVSHLRHIPILDINDNYPIFYNRPYSFHLFENTEVGKQVFQNITVQDKDGGINGDVILSCIPPEDGTCKTFDITTEKVADGQYKGIITLLKPLDFETRSSYSLTIKATDRAKDPSRRLSATANVVVEVLDIQDQPPVFLNAPYSATVPENTEEDTVILRVGARDGDVGDPRMVRIEIKDDNLGYFKLIPENNTEDGDPNDFSKFYNIVTSDILLDRENPEILQNGGIYTFTLRATELINKELPADYSETTVTIVITDEDDQLPKFNHEVFHVNVSENIAAESPLPGLNMIIKDEDVGDNAQYQLSLREIENVHNTFVVQPESGSGRTAVIIRVNDTSALDYDVEDESLRTLVFDIVVGVANEYNVVREVGKSRVIVHLEDANDNAPMFSNHSYYLSVPESLPPHTMIYNVSATDKDSGIFGEISYYLKGFGSLKFKTDPLKGGIFISSTPLDYEKQKSFALNLVAVDGGNKTSSVNIYIDVEDVNDNKPEFEFKEYNRIVKEGAKAFQPEFYVHAVDVDGPQQGGGKILYEIVSKNYNNDVISINKDTGELIINGEASSDDTPKGQYEMVIRAWDYGVPQLYEDVRVNVRVGVEGNQRPYFKGNAKNQNGISIYKVNIKENIKPNTIIKKLEAVDPDGIDSKLIYQIAKGGKDNFVLGEASGTLKTSPYSNFDQRDNTRLYELQVIAIDSGSPVPETGTTTVLVTVEDINNKGPHFSETSYSAYINENAEVNSTVLTVQAIDEDDNHEIIYKILKPLKIYNKAGLVTESREDLFVINEKKGEILLNKRLKQETINYIVLKVEAEDIKAEENEQKAVAEILVYIQASNNKNPIFLSKNWTPKNPIVKIKINEEIEKNVIVYTLKAKDPIKNKTKIKYESTKNDYYDIFNVSENGNVIMLKKLDYETLDQKNYNISIRAIVNEDLYQDIKNAKETMVDLENLPRIRYTDSILNIEIININDNPPVFEEESYQKRVLENTKYPEVIFKVKANDLDNDPVTYSISGEGSNYFLINATSGEVMIAPNVTLDREKRSFYKFNITASDKNLSIGTKIHKTMVQANVEVLDVNDSPPVFDRNFYSTVIPENVNVGTMILKVHATDLDLGLSGEVSYQIIEENEAVKFFKIDQETGEITTNKILTGKGRPEPYNIIVKASDKGDHVLDSNGKQYQKSLSSEVTLSIYIGDVIKNDGVPVFIKPSLNQRVELSENASISIPVFQVIATDPDNPNSAEGQIRYKFLDEGIMADENPFKIHPETGLISTRLPLDREKKSSYDLIIVAEDRGLVPQQANRILHIEILDVDDHKPHFKRSIDDSPIVMKLMEESPAGTEVGFVQAFDEDIGENALIDYIISYGNVNNTFNIIRTEDNIGVIVTSGRIDREQEGRHLLTIKCYKMAEDGKKLNYLKPYNAQDPSERQVMIIVEDVDDNNPKFENKNKTIGVRLNVPPDTSLLTVKAIDEDEKSAPIEYYIHNITFTNLGKYDYFTKGMMNSSDKLFQIDWKTGELKTTNSLQKYSNGFFDIAIFANNTQDASRKANMSVRIFMLRDRALMKFVFNDPPIEVKKRIPELELALAEAAQVPSVNVYDTQFHSKPDGSLDFSSTSSCFQMVGKEPYSVQEMESLLKDPKNKNIKRVFSKFNIQEVTRCSFSTLKSEISWIEIWVLVLSVLVGIMALLATCTIYCLYKRFKRKTKKLRKRRPASTGDYTSVKAGSHLVPRGGSVLGSQSIIPNSQLSGSQLYISRSDKSVLGSQFLVAKGSQLMINQPATQMGSQLIINNPQKASPTPPPPPPPSVPIPPAPQSSYSNLGHDPILMGSSQMLVPNRAVIVSETNYEEQDRIFQNEDFGSQVMYEYVGDGADNLAFDEET